MSKSAIKQTRRSDSGKTAAQRIVAAIKQIVRHKRLVNRRAAAASHNGARRSRQHREANHRTKIIVRNERQARGVDGVAGGVRQSSVGGKRRRHAQLSARHRR